MNKTILFSFFLFTSLVTSQNSFKYGFESCQVTCGEGGRSGRHGNLIRGKQGPKGEPGVACDLGESFKEEYSELKRNISWFVSRIHRNEMLRTYVCGSGVQNANMVRDDQIHAVSSWDDQNFHLPKYARLFSQSHGGSWIAGIAKHNSREKDRWIQVNFESNRTVTAVVTQGRGTTNSYVRTFNILYKRLDSGSFEYVSDESGDPKIFPGNTDANTLVINDFSQPITAQVFRINAISYHNHIAVRFDFLEC